MATKTIGMMPGFDEEDGEQYHIKSADGQILGPFKTDLVKQMIRLGKLKGEEGVSRDRNLWIPIMAIPQFSAVFSQGKSSGRMGSPLGVSHEDLPAAAPRRAFGGPPELPMAKPRSFGPSMGASDLPQSAGSDPFAGIGVTSAGNALPLPDNPFGESSPTRSGPMGAELPAPVGPTGFSELPMPSGTQLPMPVGTQLPASAGSQLPKSAGTMQLPVPSGFTNLPMPSPLPPASFGNIDLPAPGALLPAPGAQLPGIGAQLPTPGAQLPAPGAQLPVPGGQLPQAGAQLPVPNDPFGGGNANDPFGGGADPFGGGADPFASSDPFAGAAKPAADPFGGGANPFAGGQTLPPEAANPFQGGATLPPEGADPFASDGAVGLDLQGNDIWEQDNGAADGESPWDGAQEEPAAAKDDYSEYFSGAPPEGDEASRAVLATDKGGAAAPRKRKSGYGTKIALLAALLIVLGGAALFVKFIIGGGGGGDQATIPTADVGAGSGNVVRAAAEMPPLTALNTGRFVDYESYAIAANQAIQDANQADDQARLLLAQALMVADDPSDAPRLAAMQTGFAALESVDATPLVQLARGAYLAATGDDRALPILSLLATGENAALANLYTGLYYIQDYRGIAQVAPVAAVPAGTAVVAPDATGAAPGSADVAVGTGSEPVDPDTDPTDGTDSDLDSDLDSDADPIQPQDFVAAALDSEALVVLTSSAQQDATLVPAHYWRGWVAYELHNYDAASEAFAAALQSQPDHINARAGAVRTLLRQGRIADANEAVQSLLEDVELSEGVLPRESSEVRLVAAEVDLARLHLRVAISNLEEAVRLYAGNATALRMLTQMYDQSGRYFDARAFLGQTTELRMDSPETQLMFVVTDIGSGEMDDAVVRAEEAIEMFPNDGRFLFEMGRIREDAAEFDSAANLYREAQMVDPGYLMPLIHLAGLSRLEARPAEAVAYLDDALSRPTVTAAVLTRIADEFLELGETNRAVAAYDQALILDRSYPYARLALVEHYLDTDQPERAVDVLSEMTTSGVDDASVSFLSARAMLEMEQYDEGIEEMIALLDSDPDNASYLYLIGRMQFGADNVESARDYFTRAYSLDPGQPNALFWQGRAELALSNEAEAVSAMSTVAANSSSGEYYYWLACALEASGQHSQALADYSRAIDIDLSWSLRNPVVFYARGRLNYLRGAGVQAYRDLRIMRTLRPDDSRAATALGWVHLENGEFEAALTALRQAVSLSPEDAEANYFLGVATLRADRDAQSAALPHLQVAYDAGYAETTPRLYRQIGFVYRDLGQSSQAIAAFQAYQNSSDSGAGSSEIRNEILRLGGRPQ